MLKRLLSVIGLAPSRRERLPGFIREVQEIRGVRVLRLRGPVGDEIGAEVEAAHHEVEKNWPELLSKPMLLDFKDTSGWDSATVAYLVQAIRKRMAAGASVGMINLSPVLLAEIEIAKLDSVFKVFDTEGEAILALSAGAGRPRVRDAAW